MKHFFCLVVCAVCSTFIGAPFASAQAKSAAKIKANTKAKKAKPSTPTRQSAIIYGQRFSYAVSAPLGWALDSKVAQSEGLSVVFYRKGQSWAKGDPVIYISLASRSPGDSLEKQAQDDKKQYQAQDPSIDVRPSTPLMTPEGRRALTQTFLHLNGKPPFEKSAYVQMPNVALTIVLSAKTRPMFDKSQTAFADVVTSLSFVTDRIPMGRVPR